MMNRLFFVLLMSLLLTACVTTKDASFTDKADPVAARQKYTQLGLAYIKQGDTVRAKQPLARALEIDPKSPEVHSALAYLFQVEKEPDRADEHFQTALKFGPDNTAIRNNYAAFLYSEKRYAVACEQLQIAAKDALYDFRSSVFENLGYCHLQQNQQAEALTAFDRAIDINANQAGALRESAILHYEKGDKEISSRYYSRYHQLVRLGSASHTAASLWLGIRLARDEGDEDAEASRLLLLKNLFPDSQEYRLARASSTP